MFQVKKIAGGLSGNMVGEGFKGYEEISRGAGVTSMYVW